MSKLLSARFWLTLMFGVTACYMAAKGKMPPEAFSAIVGVVITHYFGKKRKDD